jgi:hypothetical protein
MILPLILCLAFALRVLPRLILRNSISSDTYFHLSMARVIRDNHHHIPETIPRIILPHRYTYPYLYHWFLSFFAERNRLHFERISSAAIDTLHVFFAYFFSKKILHVAGLPEQAENVALWTALLVAVSPAFLAVGKGPRAYNGSPRPLGQLFFLLYMCSLILFSLSQIKAWLLLSICSAMLISITSKFANQVAIFFGVFLCLFGNYVPLAAFVAGLILAGMITKGKAFRVIGTQVSFSMYYFKKLQKKYLQPQAKNLTLYLKSVNDNLKLLSTYLKRMLKHRRVTMPPADSLYWFFTESYWLHIIFSLFPQLIIIVVISVGWRETLTLNPIASSLGKVLGLWIMASFILLLITSLRTFLFLGEAVRYVENTVMPQMLAVGLYVFVLDELPILYALFVYSLIAYSAFVKIYCSSYRREQDIIEKFLPLLTKIDKPGARIFGIGTFFWPLLYGTHQADILCPMSEVATNDWDFVYGNYPFPGVKIKQVVDKYKIDYLVGSKATVESYEKILLDSTFSEGKFSLIDAENGFRIYECKY